MSTWLVFAITDDEAAVEASKQEIIRRYYQTVLDFKAEKVGEAAVKKIELLMNDLGITPADRKVAVAARQKAEETGGPALALELPTGEIVTGKNSELFGLQPLLLSTPSRNQLTLLKK